MPTLDRLAGYLNDINPFVGLGFLLLGVILLRRGADRAVGFLIGWGGLVLFTGAWGWAVRWWFMAAPGSFPAPWMTTISTLCIVLGRVYLWVVAGYAVYRLWTSPKTRRG